MATHSAVAKVGKKIKKQKTKLAIKMVKKQGQIEAKGAKAKAKARIKGIKKRGR